MKVNLAIPYRASDGTRREAYERVIKELITLFPFSSFAVFDSHHSDFNRSASRNLAINQNSDADVVVLCDADSIPEKEPLRDAIYGAQTDGLVHYPFDTVNQLTMTSTRRVGTVPLSALRVMQRYGPSEGGCWVLRPETWWKAGGMDERISGWGQEDRAFQLTNHLLVGKPVIHPGNLYCLWHDRGGIIFNPKDADILNSYMSMKDDFYSMRAYLNARGHYEQKL
jgi:glycosyltransferase involved in cell wall biosynthesis